MAIGIGKGLTGNRTNPSSDTVPSAYSLNEGGIQVFNPNFPVAGVDQPSSSFRINYKVIQEAIENLQSRQIKLTGDVAGKIVVKSGMGVIDNPANGGIIDSGVGPIEIETSLAGSFLPTSGGTITGNLTMGPNSVITSATDQNLAVRSSGGFLVLQGLKWPTSDGTNKQVLATNGTGTLSWSTRLIDVVDDTSPTLGGDLETNGKLIKGQPYIDLVVDDPLGRVRISGSSQKSGRLTAGNAEAGSSVGGGDLIISGGRGDGSGDGGATIIGVGDAGSSGYPGQIKIQYRVGIAPYAIWPDATPVGGATITGDENHHWVLATDEPGNLKWILRGGGGGGEGSLTSINTTAPITGGLITTTGTLGFSMTNLTVKNPPSLADWVVLQDNSTNAIRKVQIQNLPGGDGGTGTLRSSGILRRALLHLFDTSTYNDDQGTPTPGLENNVSKKVKWFNTTLQVPNEVDDKWFDIANPERLTIPEGINQVRIFAGFKLTLDAPSGADDQWTSGLIRVAIVKNDDDETPIIGSPSITVTPRTTDQRHTISIASPALDVEPGDYFHVEIFQNTGYGYVKVLEENTYFAIEEVVKGVQYLDNIADVNVGDPPTPDKDTHVLSWDNNTGKFVLLPNPGGGSHTEYAVLVGAADATFTAVGPDASSDKYLRSQGANANPVFNYVSNLRETTSGVLTLASTGTASDVNYVQVSSSIGGASPAIAPVGQDTNISLTLGRKGTGYIVSPSGYDMSAGPAEAFVTKDYLGEEASRLEGLITASGDVTGAANIGSGSGVYKEKVTGELKLRSIGAGTGIDVSIVNDDVVVSIDATEPNAQGVNGSIQWNDNGFIAGDSAFFTDGIGNVTIAFGSLTVEKIVIDNNVIRTEGDTDEDLTLLPSGAGLILTDPTYDPIDGPGHTIVNKAYLEEYVVQSTIWVSGVTADRPGAFGGTRADETPVIGQTYFDTTLAAGAGKPIWFNGTIWVDATGTGV